MLGVLLSAIAIRHACNWLGLGQITYGNAIKTSVIANFSTLAINAAIGFQYGLMAAATSGGRESDLMERLAFQTSPIQMVYMTALSLVIAASIYQMIIKPKSQAPVFQKEGDLGPTSRDLKFTEALGLVAFSQGITVAVIMLLYALVMYIMWMIMWVF